MFLLKELIKPIKKLILKETNFQPHLIENITYDSNKVIDNSLFFCLSAEEFNEIGIIPPLQSYKKAIKKGAVAIISDKKQELESTKNITWIQVSNEYLAMALIAKKFYQVALEKSKIIGITGTNGKTTTNQLLDNILSAFKKEVASIGTLGIMYQQRNIFTGLTTPIIIDLYKNLSGYEDPDYLVLELTSHSSHFQRTVSLEFDFLIFTNLTSDHLDFHISWENYKKAKLEYFVRLKMQKKRGIVLINKDDSISEEIIKIVEKNKIYSYSLRNQNADFFAKIIKIDDSGSIYKVFSKGKELGKISIALPGLFNIYNSFACFCTCYLLGFPIKKILEYLANITFITGRFEKILNPLGCNIFVDYAHTSDSLQNILTSISNDFPKKNKKKLLIVFGCGGDRDRQKRPKMGKIAAEWCNEIILTNDNPRKESPQKILKEIYQGIPKEKRKFTTVIPDRRKAIYFALDKLKKDDILLVAGKGHENYQIIGEKKEYFLDKEVILKYFNEKNEK